MINCLSYDSQYVDNLIELMESLSLNCYNTCIVTLDWRLVEDDKINV
jgi:hypothetical protein